MKTNFTAAQLQHRPVREANAILQECVHYGFCTNTCPTYVLTRDENDAPRGRIDLIRQMLEKGGPPDARTVYHLDRCLSCLTCKTSCAVKVDYMHLIDIARDHIESHHRRPLGERLLRSVVAHVVPHATRFRIALRLARLAGPLVRFAPRGLRRLIELSPSRLPPAPAAEFGVFRAEPGTRRRRIALLAGCAQRVLDPEINNATVRVLQRHGCDVEILRGAECCGAMTLHMGKKQLGLDTARKVIEAWSAGLEGYDAIVTNASGCGTVLKDYGRLFADDAIYSGRASALSAKVRDVSEFLAWLGITPHVKLEFEAVYHDACSLRNAQGVTQQPRDLLKACGLVVHDTPEGHFCCGSAGTYNIFQPELADTLGRRKATNMSSTGSQFGVIGNIGCLAQLHRFSDMPLVHTVQVLDWATGGPRPVVLEHLVPRKTGNPSAPAATEALW